jgi:hypothetical protein
MGTAPTVNFLRYAPDNRPISGVVTEKWLLKNYKLVTRPENKAWTNPQINPLMMKRRRLYLKTQSVPRSKHFSSRL